MTAELAYRLSRAFNQTSQYWLNFHTAYDLKMAEIEIEVNFEDSLLELRASTAA